MNELMICRRCNTRIGFHKTLRAADDIGYICKNSGRGILLLYRPPRDRDQKYADNLAEAVTRQETLIKTLTQMLTRVTNSTALRKNLEYHIRRLSYLKTLHAANGIR